MFCYGLAEDVLELANLVATVRPRGEIVAFYGEPADGKLWRLDAFDRRRQLGDVGSRQGRGAWEVTLESSRHGCNDFI